MITVETTIRIQRARKGQKPAEGLFDPSSWHNQGYLGCKRALHKWCIPSSKSRYYGKQKVTLESKYAKCTESALPHSFCFTYSRGPTITCLHIHIYINTCAQTPLSHPFSFSSLCVSLRFVSWFLIPSLPQCLTFIIFKIRNTNYWKCMQLATLSQFTVLNLLPQAKTTDFFFRTRTKTQFKSAPSPHSQQLGI